MRFFAKPHFPLVVLRKNENQYTLRSVMQKKLYFKLNAELYITDPELVLFLQADDHYTIVNYVNGTHFMIPFGLSKVEELIAETLVGDCYLVRLGRKYIINTRCVFHINTIKQVVTLSDNHGLNHSLHLPKAILKELMELLYIE